MRAADVNRSHRDSVMRNIGKQIACPPGLSSTIEHKYIVRTKQKLLIPVFFNYYGIIIIADSYHKE